MKKYLKMNLDYLKYLLRHKWYVLCECKHQNILWRGLVHDLSKFLPSEFIPYRDWFYGDYGCNFDKDNPAWYEKFEHSLVKGRFENAWLKHQKRNKHHFQYWVLINDSDGIKPLRMPYKYQRELFADWVGAGQAITGDRYNIVGWYQKNKDKMIIENVTRQWIERDIAALEM